MSYPVSLVTIALLISSIDAFAEQVSQGQPRSINGATFPSKDMEIAVDDSLVFSPLRMLVVRKSGAVVPFKCLLWEKSEYWSKTGGLPFHIINAGNIDILWNNCSIVVQRTPGILEEFHLPEQGSGIEAVTYDGQDIWAYETNQSIFAWSKSGDLLANAGKATGTLPSDGGVRMAGLEPGHVFAVGASKNAGEFWCAHLKRTGNQIAVKRFFNATKQFPGTKGVSASPDLEWAFQPYVLAELPLSESASGRTFVLEREMGGKFGLRIRPADHEVSTFEFKLAAHPTTGTKRVYYHLPNGQSLLAYGHDIRIAPTESPNQGKQRFKTLALLLYDLFYGKVFEQDGQLYAPGMTWIRIDPNSLQCSLIPNERPWFSSTGMTIGRSVHLGIICWDQNGRFYQALRSDRDAAAPHLTAAANHSGGESPGALRKAVEAIYAFRNKNGVWPERLTDLVPDHLQEVPRGLKYDYDPFGTVVLKSTARKKKSGNEPNAFIFSTHEEGWYVLNKKQRAKPVIGPSIPTRVGAYNSSSLVDAGNRYFSLRIKRSPEDEKVRLFQADFLISRGSIELADEAVNQWIAAFPASFDAREALIELERMKRTGRRDFDPQSRTYAKQLDTESVLADWRIRERQDSFNRKAVDALGSNWVAGPHEWPIAEYAAFEFARSCYLSKYDDEAITVCNRIQEESPKWSERIDPSFRIIKAAAMLRSGDAAGAHEEVESIEATADAPRFIQASVKPLIEAIEASDSSYELEHWQLNQLDRAWPLTAATQAEY